MIARTTSIQLNGAEGFPVLIETQASTGIHLVGLSDAAAKESLLRTFSALQSQGFHIPGKEFVVNISPADLHKTGSAYDLPIALDIIAVSGQKELPDLERFLIVGELGLDGTVREVPGCVQAVGAAILSGCKGLIIPKNNGIEIVDLMQERYIPIYGVSSLMEAVSVLSGEGTVPTIWDDPVNAPTENRVPEEPAWNRISGNEGAKRAIEIAAAGGHHVLLAGASETERSLLAKALRDILPPMTHEEAIDVARIWSASGKGVLRAAGTEGTFTRPYRASHFASSVAAVIGGSPGADILPGEVSLSSGGVLHIDDFAQMPKSVKEALRGPIEDKKVVIPRLKTRVEIPSRFQLVTGTPLCPCGHYGEGERCICTENQRYAYLQRLSGPVMDHIDIQAFVHRNEIPAWVKNTSPEGEDAASVRERVTKAREIQRRRFDNGRLNADMKASDISRFCELGENEKELMEKLIERLGLSARSYTRILKIARTIADLDEREYIRNSDLAEASSFRFLDKNNMAIKP